MTRRRSTAHEMRWLQQLDAGPSPVRADAGLRLAEIALERDEANRAELLLRAASNEDDSAGAARAAFALGQLLQQTDRAEEASRAFEHAAALSDPARTSDVHCNLAARWWALGNFDEALHAYSAIIAAVGPDASDATRADAAVAALRLGELYAEIHEWVDAENAWRAAIDTGDEEVAPWAALKLAKQLAWLRERPDHIEALLDKAVDLDHADASPEAGLLLAELLEKRQDYARASEMYALVADSGHPEFADKASARVRAGVVGEPLGGRAGEPADRPAGASGGPLALVVHVLAIFGQWLDQLSSTDNQHRAMIPAGPHEHVQALASAAGLSHASSAELRAARRRPARNARARVRPTVTPNIEQNVDDTVSEIDHDDRRSVVDAEGHDHGPASSLAVIDSGEE